MRPPYAPGKPLTADEAAREIGWRRRAQGEQQMDTPAICRVDWFRVARPTPRECSRFQR